MISVVLASYNGSKFINDQLDSILNQTYKAFEIICVDDCSTDDTYKILEEYKEEIDSVIRYVDSSIEQSEKLMQKDIEAFTTFMAAYKLPKETTEQKEIRFHSIQQALIKATEIPLEIARLGVETMEQTLKIVSYANRTAISDLGVSAYLLSASVSSVLLTVDINLPLIKDEISVKHYQQNRDLLDSKSKSLKNSIATTVNQRINS